MNFILILTGLISTFVQTNLMDDTNSEIQGKIFLSDNDAIYIHVVVPIDQYMRLSDDKLLIYYPVEGRAFEFDQPQHELQSMNQLPSLDPMDLDVITSMGFENINSNFKDDTLTTQYIQKSRKSQYPLLTVKSVEGQINNMTMAVNGNENYNLFVEVFGQLDSIRYMKKYTTSITVNSKMIEKTIFQFDDLRYATEADALEMIFIVPKEVVIERILDDEKIH